ncbi:MAG: ribosomal RNA small subunit methyltransferase A [Anaerolineae bacterium]|nr:ribosomal RNA small subunit methyltransferase A [Anaerolineae bacterium]
MEDPRVILRRYHLVPRKSLGQNFLVEPAMLARIVSSAELGPEDTVLEIGAGLGTMTAVLSTQAGHVIAVETDPGLIQILSAELAVFNNVRVVHGDILQLDLPSLLEVFPAEGIPLWGTRLPHYHVVANLPYYITAAVLRHLLEAPARPASVTVTVQREVAQRIVALPGDMSLLAVSVQFYGRPQILFRLKRGVFYPAPRVESAVLRIDSYEVPPVSITSVAGFFRVVQAGFAQRRKQLRNTLAATLRLSAHDVGIALLTVGIDPARRAETLSLKEWGSVFEALSPLLDAAIE